MKLSDINANIDRLWDELKVTAIGTADIGKALLITSNPEALSLPAIYQEALNEAGGNSDVETLNGLLKVCGNYLEAEKAKLKAKLFNKLKNLEAQSDVLSDKEAWEFLEEELSKIFNEARFNIERIISSESQNVKNIAFLNGIMKTSEYFGISDPTVVFLTTKDMDVCKDCLKVHCIGMDVNKPRPWKLSEVLFDYAPRHPTIPSIQNLHPMCRCLMILVQPGFGYKNGQLAYISRDYDYYKANS